MVKIAKSSTILQASDIDSFLYGSTDLIKVHTELIRKMPVIAVICGVAKPITMPKRRRKKPAQATITPPTEAKI